MLAKFLPVLVYPTKMIVSLQPNFLTHGHCQKRHGFRSSLTGLFLITCHRVVGCCGLLLLLLPLLLTPALAVAKDSKLNSEKTTLGWLQSIRLLPDNSRMTAKIDTGAKSSAIHAEDLRTFRNNGVAYIRFTIPVTHKYRKAERLEFELPIVKTTRIKRHDGQQSDNRTVVELEICLNHKKYKALFSLDNRKDFNYPVLLGRDFLTQNFIVDPAKKFLHRSYCPKPSKLPKA